MSTLATCCACRATTAALPLPPIVPPPRYCRWCCRRAATHCTAATAPWSIVLQHTPAHRVVVVAVRRLAAAAVLLLVVPWVTVAITRLLPLQWALSSCHHGWGELALCCGAPHRAR